MKWSRSNKMTETFNCIAHPHTTSCGKLSPSSVGMDVVMNRWRTMLLQKMSRWMVHMGFFYRFSTPSSHGYKHSRPQTHISHTNTHTHNVFSQTSNKPGYQKTINGPLSSAILRKLSALCREFRCQPHTQRQSRAQILTRAIHYLWHQKTRQILKCHLVTFWRS